MSKKIMERASSQKKPDELYSDINVQKLKEEIDSADFLIEILMTFYAHARLAFMTKLLNLPKNEDVLQARDFPCDDDWLEKVMKTQKEAGCILNCIPNSRSHPHREVVKRRLIDHSSHYSRLPRPAQFIKKDPSRSTLPKPINPANSLPSNFLFNNQTPYLNQPMANMQLNLLSPWGSPFAPTLVSYQMPHFCGYTSTLQENAAGGRIKRPHYLETPGNPVKKQRIDESNNNLPIEPVMAIIMPDTTIISDCESRSYSKSTFLQWGPGFFDNSKVEDASLTNKITTPKFHL